MNRKFVQTMFALTKISDAPLTKCSTDINVKDVQHVLKILKNKKNIRTAEIHTAYIFSKILTSGTNGGSTIPASNLLKFIFLKNA